MSLAAGRFCVVACQLPSPTQWNSTNCKCTLLQAHTAHCHSGHAHAPWPLLPTVKHSILSPHTLFSWFLLAINKKMRGQSKEQRSPLCFCKSRCGGIQSHHCLCAKNCSNHWIVPLLVKKGWPESTVWDCMCLRTLTSLPRQALCIAAEGQKAAGGKEE